MKVEIGKEWCIYMAELEAGTEIGAGLLAVDPVFDDEAVPTIVSGDNKPILCHRNDARSERSNPTKDQ